MSRLKKFFFVLVFGLVLGAAATLAYSTESQADNAGDYNFFIVHSSECSCGNNNNVYNTVILGSTHTYTIQSHTDFHFQEAIWNCEDFENTTISLNGENATITFDKTGSYTILASVTDTNGQTYHPTITITVVTENFDDTYLNICAKKRETVSITPQFLMFSKDYPDGVLTTITENIDWNTDQIASMTPAEDNGILTFTPDRSGEYSIFVTFKLPASGFPYGKTIATTSYTIFIPEKEVNLGQSISSTGQQNEYVYFTPDATGRYKINWKSYSNSGYESLYDSDGNQVSRVDDYLGGYRLTEDETYFMKLYYSTPTNSNSYSIDLYNSDDNDDSDSNPSDNNPGGDNGSSSKPDKNPSVPSGQPSQGNSAGGSNNNNSAVAPAPTTKVSVSKVKGKPKLKLKKGKVKLTFKKVKGADGYEICYATNKKFKKSKKMTVKSPKATLKKPKKGKKYFIKVRAFKRNASSKKVFGTYSKTVKIAIKK